MERDSWRDSSLPGPLDQQSPNVVWTEELQTNSPKRPQATHGGVSGSYKYSVAKTDVIPFRQGLPHEAAHSSAGTANAWEVGTAQIHLQPPCRGVRRWRTLTTARQGDYSSVLGVETEG